MYVIEDGATSTSVLPISALATAATKGSLGVYQLFAATGQLLYVGRTSQLPTRLHTHERTQPWWPLVEFGQWTRVDNYGEAVALERHAIETDGALFNVAAKTPLQESMQHLPAEEESILLDLYEDGERTGAVDHYMAALRAAGWTLAAIGRPIGITRERVRQRVAKVEQVDPSISVTAFVKPERKSRRKVWPTLTNEEREELARLQPVARNCRGRTPADHPARKASERISEIAAEANLRGVRDKDIAEPLGVTPGAVRQRLKIHGYFRTAPSQTQYGSKPFVRPKTCRRGHPFTGDNVRLINGDEARRICKACERVRVERYREGLAERLEAS